MNCELCSTEMNFLYDVVERETLFVLWECECSHKLLERRPADRALTGVVSSVEDFSQSLELDYDF